MAGVTMRMRALFGPVLAGLVLVGCADSGTGSAPATPDGTPSFTVYSAPAVPVTCTESPSTYIRTCLGWGPGRTLYLVTYGGSSCPYVAVSARSSQPQVVVLSTVGLGGPSCTADSVPTTSSVQVPESIDPAMPVSVELSYVTLELPPRQS